MQSLPGGRLRRATRGRAAPSPGRERRRAGGTLILTEVAELSAEAQALLQRYLTAWEASRANPRPGARVIATTSRDLAAEVGLGAFRRDLYYRLCVVPLALPPLRDRPGDILALVEEIGARVAQAQRQRLPRYTAMALRLLRRYTWPGNVRELRNLCERMAILFGGREVTPDDLPWEIRRGDADSGGARLLPASTERHRPDGLGGGADPPGAGDGLGQQVPGRPAPGPDPRHPALSDGEAPNQGVTATVAHVTVLSLTLFRQIFSE